MKNFEDKHSLLNFKGYEDARKTRTEERPIPATKKAVKAALNRINPDGNTQERG